MRRPMWLCALVLPCFVFFVRFAVVHFVTAAELTPSTSTDSTAGRESPPVAAAEASRYFAFFGTYQAEDNAIECSHTFAVFFRTVDDGGKRRVAETCTISWLPASDVVSLARPAEPGVNKSPADTIAAAEQKKLQILFDGPFETDAVLFRRAVEQAAKLDRGELRYKCFDRYSRDTAKNCIHAISDLDETDGRLYSLSARGREATQLAVHHLSSHFLRPDEVPPAVADVLFDAVHLHRFSDSTTGEAIAGVGGGARP